MEFITYPFQDEIIMWDAWCCEQGVDNLLEKSRDMGATWMLVVNDIHDWLFGQEKIEIRWGSRKEDYVDTRGDMDSIFEKFRFVLKYMHPWMLPKGFKFQEHDLTMRLINPETGSSITGESTNSSFGRGGRKYRVRFDEYAFWDCDKESWEGCADVTKCRTAISTPNGSGNHFAHLANETNIEKRSIHWSLHPVKNLGAYYLSGKEEVPIDVSRESVIYDIWQHRRGEVATDRKGGVVRSRWYDAECERRDGTSIAQELDINYLQSGSQFFDARGIALQKPWQFAEIEPGSTIAWGTYITGKIVEVGQKLEFRQVPEGRGGWIRMYERPNEYSQYVLGADTAEGLPKGDQCAGVLRDKYTRNVIAVILNNEAPEVFARQLWLLERYYGAVRVAAENNNHGYTVNKDLEELGSNIYMTKMSENRMKRGWTTSNTTRLPMLDDLAEEVRLNSCELRDERLIKQLSTFVRPERKPQHPEADGSFKDDAILACAIAGAVIAEEPYKAKSSEDSKRAALRERLLRDRKNAGLTFRKTA